MKQFALQLGFDFDEFWAFLTPVEKVLDYLDSSKKLSPDVIKIIKNLGFEPKSYLKSLKSFPMQDCAYLKNQLILNSEGFVQLCCATFSPILSIGFFLELSPQQIQEKRNNSEMCKACLKNRIHMYYGSKWGENDLTPIKPN